MMSYGIWIVLVIVQNTVSMHIPSNLIQQIKPAVRTSMSSTSNYKSPPNTWDSANAIDYNVSGDPNKCGCCASTKGAGHDWLKIDLGGQYNIGSIILLGRTDGSSPEQYHNLSVVIADAANHSTLVYKGNPNQGAYMFNITFRRPKLFQYLKIQQRTHWPLTICEVVVEEQRNSTCELGHFGQDCSQECHCANNTSCHRTHGVCSTSDCLPGWQGYSCDKVGSEEKRQTKDKTNDKYPAIIGSVSGFVGGFIIGVIVSVLVYKNRKVTREENKTKYTDIHIQQQTSGDYDTLDYKNDHEREGRHTYENDVGAL